MKKNYELACREILTQVKLGNIKTTRDLKRFKSKFAREYGLTKVPSNFDIMRFATEEEKKKFSEILRMKPTRIISGVVVITVVAKPARCPGSCIYCPKGVNAPQSYTGLEPAVQRAIRNNYNPFLQVKDRLFQYEHMGYAQANKIEVIILGGTFLALNKKYQEWFIKRIFDALNGRRSRSLKQAQKLNEKALFRCVGLTIETRADYCFEKHIDQMLKLGATRVEIGIQSVYEDVLKRVSRGHTVRDAIKAIRLAKDSALKCTLHVMPGLPGVDFKRDLEQFKILFSNPDFKPDSLKIYPTLVVKGTELYDMWKNGKYQPLDTKKAIKLVARAMKFIPKYCRVIRVQRDIPKPKIVAGVKKSNLRELVEKKCDELGIKIKEIRYREAGRRTREGILPDVEHTKLCRLDYDASHGREVFLSFEDKRNDVLIGFCRLRIPFEPFRPEIDKKTALVRELHVYGPLVPISEVKDGALQHRGFGRILLEEAEKIAREEFDMKKTIVISGVGVRQYYFNLGYRQDGAYVSKAI